MPARRIRTAFLLSCAAFFLAACGGEPEPGAKAYVATVPDSDFYVGVGVEGEQIVALVTDGRSTGVWLTGTLEGNSMYLTAPGDSRLSGRIVDDTVEGTLSLGGRSYSFDAPLADESGGLYRSQRGEEVRGWVVLPDGRQKGVRTSDGETSPAPPLEVFAA